MKRVILKKLLLCMFIICFAAVSVGATKFSKVYDEATQRMVDGDYAGAAEIFDSIANYEDASTLSMYCKANLLAEQGNYDEAIAALEFFGDYKDCKYLVVYYSACKLEAEASDRPIQYWEAAEKFKSISLFRDSSARSNVCRQKLYDIASQKLAMGNYYDAYNYFAKLDDFSDSPRRILECYYGQAMAFMGEHEFASAAELFERAGDYEDAREKQVLAEKLAAMEFDQEFLLINERYHTIYEYSDNIFYLDDVAELLSDYYGMRVKNLSNEIVKYTVSCEIDDESFTWKESSLDSGKTTWYSFTTMNDPEFFQAGVHNCVWFIDDVEVLAGSFTVAPGVSEERQQAAAMVDSLNVALAVAQYDEVEDELFGLIDSDRIAYSDLLEGKKYVPAFIIGNPTEDTVSFEPVAIVDGEFLEWDTLNIEASRFNRLFSSNGINKGSHRMQLLINGVPAADWTFEIVDKLEESPALSDEIKPEIGKTYRFGQYEQDNDLTNGAEDIEWIVLDIRDGAALLISKYALNCVPYNKDTVDVTWETCTLRTWLNHDFLTTAFSEDEQERILLTVIDNGQKQGNPESEATGGNDTNDKVFLLSYDEASRYFGTDISRICRATPYASAQERCTVDELGTCFWWLRSPGFLQDTASFVPSMGIIDSGASVGYTQHTDRPAMWVDIGDFNSSGENDGTDKITTTGSADGIAGEIVVQVVADETTIYSVEILQQSETPGIGSVAVERLPDAIVAANTWDVDGVAGATITSTAIRDAVKQALTKAGFDPEAYGADANG